MHYASFCHLAWACLFVFLITKKPKVIFLAAVKALSLPPAEGSVSASAPHSQFLNTGQDRRGVSE